MQGSHDLRPFALRLGMSLLRRSHMTGLLAVAFGLPLGATAALLYASLPPGTDAGTVGGAMQEALQSFVQENADVRWQLWALAVLAPLGAVFAAGHRLAWLRVTASGLQGHVPRWLGLGIVGQSTGRWDVSWERIRAVHLAAPPGRRVSIQKLAWYRLVIETDRETIRINPFTWFRPDAPDHRVGLRELSLRGGLDVERCLLRAPLVEALQARGFEIDRSGTTGDDAAAAVPDRSGFDLAGHRGMVVLLVVFFAAGLYALADAFFLGTWEALEPLSWWPFVAAALPALAGAWRLGRGAPRAERLVVGGLAAAAVVAAVHPALLRINAATAEPRVHEYVATTPGRFLPPRDALPALDLTNKDLDAYWAQYPEGATHEFTLLRGAGGFQQLDLAPLYERTRAFYEARRDP